jgi:biotin transport system substrate-specific component
MELAVTKRVRAFLHEIPEKSHGLRLSLAVVGAFLTAVSAQVMIPLPFTPVPLTLQVFCVLVTAALLGPFYGGLSQALYVTAGMVGLPFFSGGMSGLQLGVNGGYIAGFVAMGGLVGFLTHHHEFRGAMWRIGVAMAVGVVVLYIFGALNVHLLRGTTYRQTLLIAVMPFVLPDLIKIYAASRIAHWVYGTRWTPVPRKRRES